MSSIGSHRGGGARVGRVVPSPPVMEAAGTVVASSGSEAYVADSLVVTASLRFGDAGAGGAAAYGVAAHGAARPGRIPCGCMPLTRGPAARKMEELFVATQGEGVHRTRVLGLASISLFFLVRGLVKTFFYEMGAPLLLGGGALCGLVAVAAARYPGYSNVLAAATALVSAAAFDPYNLALEGWTSGLPQEATAQLIAYGALPFLCAVVVSPPISVMLLVAVGHTARAFIRLPTMCGVFVLLVSLFAVMQQYWKERAARQGFLVSLALERAHRRHATAVERRRAALDASARFERSFRYICHELRNPLHCVCAGVALLALEERAMSAQGLEQLRSITEGLNVITNITNDLTDLQKLRAGKFVVHPVPTNLRTLLGDCVLAVLPMVESRSELIKLVFDGSVPESIVVNGLTNAMKYAPPATRGAILVVCCVRHSFGWSVASRDEGGVRAGGGGGGGGGGGLEDAGHISIEVIDCGPGLHGQSERELFQDFGSAAPVAHTGAVSAVGSSGLGLAISKRMSRLLGGNLSVVERSDGVQGTRFTLSLPLPVVSRGDGTSSAHASIAQRSRTSPPLLMHRDATAPAAAGAAARASGVSGGLWPGGIGGSEGEEDMGALLRRPLEPVREPGDGMASIATSPRRVREFSPDGSPPVRAAPVGAPLGLCILLVDDSSGNRRVGARILGRLGCTCTLATDGDEVPGAMATAAASGPGGEFDAIFMDVSMNRVGGDTACARLRAEGCSIPIIAVSGNATPELIGRYGFTAVIEKPFSEAALRAALVAHVAIEMAGGRRPAAGSAGVGPAMS